jgi:hypothetical protein
MFELSTPSRLLGTLTKMKRKNVRHVQYYFTIWQFAIQSGDQIYHCAVTGIRVSGSGYVVRQAP